MSVEHYQREVARSLKDIAELERKVSDEDRKLANIMSKQASVQSSMTGRMSSSTLSSKTREMERLVAEAARAQSSRADITKRIAGKRSDLVRVQERLSQAEGDARKKSAEETRSFHRNLERQDKRRQEEQERRELDLQRQLSELKIAATAPREGTYGEAEEPISTSQHDFFVSHASEDKEAFVRPLAEALRARGAGVWYDEFSLRIGDSLRRKVDQGLLNSRFGIVVLSESFFRKEWPQRELDGLTAMEVGGRSRILPIWHKISKDEVLHYSPVLADKLALNTATKSIAEIVDALTELLK